MYILPLRGVVRAKWACADAVNTAVPRDGVKSLVNTCITIGHVTYR